MCRVFDVAKYILSEIGEVSTMKLQKLCYYSLVEGLVSPQQVAIFPNKFEAWANGPVCRDLWNVHKGLFYVDKKIIPAALLSRKEIPVAYKNYINTALEKYGKKTGTELSELTHNEKPWQDAIKNVNSARNSRHVISNKAIIEFYKRK
jgi:uncharacterized phage-associated protein